MKKIDIALKKKNQLFILNGTGGIGKTTLAIEYLNRYESSYSHLAFVEYSNDIKESFLTAFKNSYELKSKTPDERFNELLFNLAKLEGRNLLIVDDIKSQDNFNAIKDLSRNFELLITSRTEFDTVHKLDIEHLTEEKAKELFLKYYKTDENIDKLLEYLDYHTLFIKLTAQTLKSSRELDVKALEEKFANGEFGKVTCNLEKSTFDRYLNELFDLNTLSDREILILKRLSLFPSIEIEYEKLKDFLCVENAAEFDADLTSLSKAGWLIENGDSFKLHQVIKEFLLLTHHISYEECEGIVKNFIEKIYHKPNENPIDKFEFIPYVVSIVDKINIENESIANFLTHISKIYHDMGKIEKSLDYGLKALNIKENILEKKDPSIGQSYNNISGIYQDMGELEKALEFQEKSLKIKKEVFEEKNPSLATSYNNISTIYQDMGELKEALEYQERALILNTEVWGEKHPNVAIAYLNISVIYFKNSNIADAKKYIYIAENIYRELFPNGHPNLDIIIQTKEVMYKS